MTTKKFKIGDYVNIKTCGIHNYSDWKYALRKKWTGVIKDIEISGYLVKWISKDINSDFKQSCYLHDENLTFPNITSMEALQ